MTAEALRRAALAAHAVLALAVAAAILGAAPSTVSAGVALLAVLPLAATFGGVRALRPRIVNAAALLMVIYAGGAAMEVIATSGTAPFAALALLASLGELALLFALSRRSRASRG